MSASDDEDDIYCPHLGPPNEKAWCSKCNGREARDAELAKTQATMIERIFTAKYDGTCANCGERFQIGDRIGLAWNGTYVCACTLP